MNITNNLSQIELKEYYELEKSKINLILGIAWREVPTGFTGVVGFKYSNKNVYYVRNFDPNTKGKRQKNFHRFDGPAVIVQNNILDRIKLHYYIYGQWLHEHEFHTIYEAYKTNDNDLLNNTIGMVFAAKEYAKKERK